MNRLACLVALLMPFALASCVMNHRGQGPGNYRPYQQPSQPLQPMAAPAAATQAPPPALIRLPSFRPHPPVAYGAGLAVTVTAPSWMNDTYLGAPLDLHFQVIRGAGAGSLFPAGDLPPTQNATFESDYYKADKELEFEANLSTWVVDAGVGYDQTNRFVSQRARQLDYVHELNDRSAMSTPPAGASWYVAKIYYGHVYENILFEHDTTLTASVAAELRPGPPCRSWSSTARSPTRPRAIRTFSGGSERTSPGALPATRRPLFLGVESVPITRY